MNTSKYEINGKPVGAFRFWLIAIPVLAGAGLLLLPFFALIATLLIGVAAIVVGAFVLIGIGWGYHKVTGRWPSWIKVVERRS